MRFAPRSIVTVTAVALAVVVVSGATAQAALAGTYTVYGCKTPAGAAAPTNSWQVGLDSSDGYHHDFWGSTCPGPVYMGMDAGFAHVDGDYAQETFVAPASTTIQSFTLSRAVRLVPSAGFLYQAWMRSAGRWTLVEGCTSASTCSNYGDYTDPSASSNVLRRTAPTDTTEVELKVLCSRSGGCPEVKSEGHVTDSIWLFQSAFTLEDDFSPRIVGAPSGPLVAPRAVLAGTVPVTIAATDRGSGVYEGIVEVDGRVLERQVLNPNGGLCQAPFVAAVPCQLSASGTIDVDTAGLADGWHSVSLLVSDAAGNTAVWGPVTVRTVNDPCRPIPASPGMTLRAWFARRAHKRIRRLNAVTVGFRRRPVVDGVLLSQAGTPVPGAPVCVAVRTDRAGAPLESVGSFSTDAAGRFRYKLGRGPSRSIFFIYRVPNGAVSHVVNVYVRPPVRVQVNGRRLINGQTMTWRGTLPGPAPGGMLALMQVWRGTRWQTFEQVRVHRDGKWVGRYRFAFTTGVQHYVFRLLVPHQSGYPYAEGVSRDIHVLVAG